MRNAISFYMSVLGLLMCLCQSASADATATVNVTVTLVLAGGAVRADGSGFHSESKCEGATVRLEDSRGKTWTATSRSDGTCMFDEVPIGKAKIRATQNNDEANLIIDVTAPIAGAELEFVHSLRSAPHHE